MFAAVPYIMTILQNMHLSLSNHRARIAKHIITDNTEQSTVVYSAQDIMSSVVC